MFNMKLLRMHIPNAQKDSQVTSVVLRFWDLRAQKHAQNVDEFQELAY